MKVVEVYREIQDQQMNIVSTFSKENNIDVSTFSKENYIDAINVIWR